MSAARAAGRRRSAAPVVALTALVAASLALAGCTGSSGGSHSTATKPHPPVAMTWTKVATLPQVRATSFGTDHAGTVYVGGSLPASAASSYSGPLIKGGTRKPVLWLSHGTTWSQAKLTVTSFYGAQATLASLDGNLGRVFALGAVAGGAHANPRPSFFVGGSGRLQEREQNFYVFGGENAVGIVAVAAAARSYLMVGQWAPDGHRASGALWTSADGVKFVRHDTIPGLGDSAGGKRTTSPQGVGVQAGRFVIVGSVTDLTKPGLSVAPAMWTTFDGTSVREGRLQSESNVLGGPSSVACDVELPRTLPDPAPPGYVAPGSCVAAGMVSAAGAQQLAIWRVAVGDKESDAAAGRQIDAGSCPAPAPAPDPGSSTPRAPTVRSAIDATGRGWVVTSTSAAGVICRVERDGTARAVTPPNGCVPLAVLASKDLAADPAPEVFCGRADGVDVYLAG